MRQQAILRTERRRPGLACEPLRLRLADWHAALPLVPTGMEWQHGKETRSLMGGQRCSLFQVVNH